MEEEIWKDIPGYEGYYQASNLGRLKSLARYTQPTVKGSRPLPERILRSNVPKGCRYAGACLQKLGVKKVISIHCLVLLAFVGPPPSKDMQCRHFPDPNPANNRLDNLQWGTREQNMADKLVHGTYKRSLAKLTIEQVLKIREIHAMGRASLELMAEMFGVRKDTILSVILRNTWKNVP